ncbi:MAG: type II toxin-antitoxin system VapC family toxin [Hormoscilla sp. GM102CHS1]|nr:type II toxin-antitoxin system VapC family toxin [Hormoscilla sp. GM102CHS1]
MATTYVVDASVLGHYFGTDTYTQEAKILVSKMSQGEQLYIPEFCLIECVNILWKNVRFQGMPQTEAERFIDELLALPFQIVLVKDLLLQALQIGLNRQLAVYDSLYIALALNLDYPLITVDDRQADAAAQNGVTLKQITDFSPAG